MILYSRVQDYICPTDPRDETTALQYAEEPDPPCSLEFLQMVRDVMNTHHISFQNTISAAVDLYVTLTTILENAM